MMKALFIYCVGIVLAVALSYGAMVVGKKITYKLFYEGQVKETVREMLAETTEEPNG